jgi:hypothetical protein
VTSRLVSAKGVTANNQGDDEGFQHFDQFSLLGCFASIGTDASFFLFFFFAKGNRCVVDGISTSVSSLLQEACDQGHLWTSVVATALSLL